MSVISNLIFGGEKHYLTSSYGKRNKISTTAGATAEFHYGTDYGTYSKKLMQYAVESGTVLSCGVASDGAKYVWVSYPRIGKKMLHYHLDTVLVKKGQAVKKGTKLGKTGKTGKATGVHLHLGVKDLKTDKYEDPEVFAKSYTPPKEYEKGVYKVTASVLNVRSGAGTDYPIKKYPSFTSNAKQQIKRLNSGKECNGYVRGVVCTVSQVKNSCWGKTPSGWVSLEYCTRV